MAGPPPRSTLFPYTTLFRSSGTWEQRRANRYALAERWLGEPTIDEPAAIIHLVRRYLAGFGPASRADIASWTGDRKSTRLNSSHLGISYAVFCLKKKKMPADQTQIKKRNTKSLKNTGPPTTLP